MSDTPTHAGDFEATSRAYARDCAAAGMAAFAQAFNHCDEGYHAHRYAPEVQERFREMCLELVALVESGRIERNPKHAQHLRAEEAKGDNALQSLLKRASRKTPIRASGGRKNG